MGVRGRCTNVFGQISKEDHFVATHTRGLIALEARKIIGDNSRATNVIHATGEESGWKPGRNIRFNMHEISKGYGTD